MFILEQYETLQLEWDLLTYLPQFNEKFNPYVNKIRAFFPKSGHLLSIFTRGLGRPSPPFPFSFAPGSHFFNKAKYANWCL